MLPPNSYFSELNIFSIYGNRDFCGTGVSVSQINAVSKVVVAARIGTSVSYAPTNRHKRVAEKAIEFLNQRVRKMDANIAYIMMFT